MASVETWEHEIREACVEAGTYMPQFDLFIRSLAKILETRDDAQHQYDESGGNPVVAYTNKGGHTNLRKNPALAVIQECNQQALTYWRDLGLTPKGYRQLSGKEVEKKGGGFEELLSGLEI